MIIDSRPFYIRKFSVANVYIALSGIYCIQALPKTAYDDDYIRGVTPLSLLSFLNQFVLHCSDQLLAVIHVSFVITLHLQRP